MNNTVEFVDSWGCKHTLTLEGAAEELKAFYDAWPGGLEEIESAVRAERQAQEPQELSMSMFANRADYERAQTAPELEADLAWHKESLNRHAEKLHSVWNGIRNAVEKYSGKPCEGEPFDRLDELLAALSAQTATAVDLASVSDVSRMTISEAREYLVDFMERHFMDKTFHRYIRGDRSGTSLAGDFAWQLARALSRPSAPAPVSLSSSGVSEQPSPVYGWLERASRSGLPEVEHSARTMMAYYQGAEFPEQPAAEQVGEEIRLVRAGLRAATEAIRWAELHTGETTADKYVQDAKKALPLAVTAIGELAGFLAHPQAAQAKESGK